MAQGHDYHHFYEFLPLLAERTPSLLSLLPEEERPDYGGADAAWVRSLQPGRRVAICRQWLEALAEELRVKDPARHRVLAAAMMLPGEFLIADLAGILFNHLTTATLRKLSEDVRALVDVGLLFSLQRDDCFVAAYPLRMAFDSGLPMSPAVNDEFEHRLIIHFAREAAALDEIPDSPMKAGWRFANILGAWEVAARRRPVHAQANEAFRDEDEALATFGRMIGVATSRRATDSTGLLFEASAAAAARIGRKDQEAELLFLLGRYWVLRKQPPRAIDAWERSATAHAAAGDTAGEALALSALGFTMREHGDLSRALRYFSLAVERARIAGRTDLEFDITNCTAAIFIDTLEPEKAIGILRDLAHKYSSKGSSEVSGMTETWVLLGRALLTAREEEDAILILERAIASAHRWRQRHHEANAGLALADACIRLRRGEDARRHAIAAWDTFREIQEVFGMTLCCARIAHACRILDDPDGVELWTDRGIEQATSAQDPRLLAVLHAERAEYFLESDDPHRGIAELLIVISALREIPDPMKMAEVFLRISGIYLQLDRHSEALRDAFRAQGLSRTVRWPFGVNASQDALERIRPHMDEALFEEVLQAVTDELDAGVFLPSPEGPRNR